MRCFSEERWAEEGDAPHVSDVLQSHSLKLKLVVVCDYLDHELER